MLYHAAAIALPPSCPNQRRWKFINRQIFATGKSRLRSLLIVNGRTKRRVTMTSRKSLSPRADENQWSHYFCVELSVMRVVFVCLFLNEQLFFKAECTIYVAIESAVELVPKSCWNPFVIPLR